MSFKSTLALLSAALLAQAALPSRSQAALVMHFSETGAGTTLAYSGTLDLTGLSFSPGFIGVDETVHLLAGHWGASGIRFNLAGATIRVYDSPWAVAPSLGDSGEDIASSTPFPQQVSILTVSLVLAEEDIVDNVWSGSGSTLFAGRTLASLVNLDTPIVWTLNESGDTVTWTTVPEPGLALGTGLALLAFLRRKRA